MFHHLFVGFCVFVVRKGVKKCTSGLSHDLGPFLENEGAFEMFFEDY